MTNANATGPVDGVMTVVGRRLVELRRHFVLQVSHPGLERDHQSFHPTEQAMEVCLKDVMGRLGGKAEGAKVRRVVVTESEMV